MKEPGKFFVITTDSVFSPASVLHGETCLTLRGVFGTVGVGIVGYNTYEQ